MRIERLTWRNNGETGRQSSPIDPELQVITGPEPFLRALREQFSVPVLDADGGPASADSVPMPAIEWAGGEDETIQEAVPPPWYVRLSLPRAAGLDHLRALAVNAGRALIDAGPDGHPTGAALRSIEAHIERTGRIETGSSKPLPAALRRLAELDEELSEARQAREQYLQMSAEIRHATDDLNQLRARQREVATKLREVNHAGRAKLLREAEEHSRRVDELTQQCFALSACRDFPLEQNGHVERVAEEAEETAGRIHEQEAALDRLNHELEQLAEAQANGEAAPMRALPKELDEDLRRLEADVEGTKRRIADIDERRAGLEEPLAAAKEALSELPEFSRMGPDPLQWVRQLVASYRAAARARDAEMVARDRLRTQVEEKEKEVAEAGRIFTHFEDFGAEATEYDFQVRLIKDHIARLNARIQQAAAAAGDHKTALPGYAFMAGVGAVLAAGFVVAAYYTGNRFVFIPAGFSGGLALFACINLLYTKWCMRRCQRQLKETEEELVSFEDMCEQRYETLRQAADEAGCENVRELEAMHDTYRADRGQLASLRERLAEQEATFEEEREHTAKLFERIVETFASLDVELSSEKQLDEAANEALARYQEYRKRKRELLTWREKQDQLKREHQNAEETLSRLNDQLIETSFRIREQLRDAGYPEEAQHASVSGALRSYRIRLAQTQQKLARRHEWEARIKQTQDYLRNERQHLADRQRSLARYLETAGLETLEQWRQRAEDCRRFRQLRDERGRVLAKLKTLLGDEKLEDLRRTVKEQGLVRATPGTDMSAEESELAELDKAIDERTARIDGMRARMDEEFSGTRVLNVIEEERAKAASEAGRLRREVEAAAYAAAVLEELDRAGRPARAAETAKAANALLNAGGQEPAAAITPELDIRPQPATDGPALAAALYLGRLAVVLAAAAVLQPEGVTLPVCIEVEALPDCLDGATVMEMLRRGAGPNQIVVLTKDPRLLEAAAKMGVPALDNSL